jgi:opacity protein-like surface antigen
MSTQGTDSEGSFNLKFNPALQGSAVIGYDFAPGNPEGEGRIELEYSHRGNRLDKVQFVEGSFTGGGNLNADSLLINFFGVFHNDTQWAPYVGAGIGAARLDASDLKVTGQPLSSDSAYVLAYQFGAGVDYPLTDRLNLDLGYRFLGSTRPTFIEATGLKFRMDYYSHSVILGLRVGF